MSSIVRRNFHSSHAMLRSQFSVSLKHGRGNFTATLPKRKPFQEPLGQRMPLIRNLSTATINTTTEDSTAHEEKKASKFPVRQQSTIHGGKGSSEQLQVARLTSSEKVKMAEQEVLAVAASSGGLAHRFHITFEVMVSKIFPAGFGWQGASCVADAQGFAADSAGFALMTGMGDGTGVLVGHTMFYGIKKAIVDPTIDMGAQVQTGLMLGTAALHAGTAWQPTVNFLHDQAHCSFNGTMVGTMVSCGTMFFVGLRVARQLLSGFMPAVAPAAYDNLKADAALSVSIGGATACFVGTDCSFVVNGMETNWLRGVVGVEDGLSDLTGMALAGSSTALGFAATQTVQNGVYPAGKNWVD